MNIFFRCTLCFIVLFLSVFFSACRSTLSEEEINHILSLDKQSEPSDMSARQIVTMMNNAIDPKGKFKTADTYLLRQRLVNRKAIEEDNGFTKKKTYQYDEYETEIKFKAPDLLCQTSFRSGREEGRLLVRGARAWSIDPKRHKAQELKEHTLELTHVFTRLSTPSMSLTDVFQNIQADCVRIGQTRAYRLVCRAENPDIAPYVVYVDSKSFLTIKAETILYTDDGDEYLYTAIPSRFESVDDILMPMVTTIETAGDVDVVTLREFKVGAKFDDSVFEVPGESF